MAGKSFSLQVGKFVRETQDDFEEATKNVVLELGRELIIRSPVLTGRFRSNWYYSADRPVDTSTLATNEPFLHGETPTVMVGRVHYIQNNLSYAMRIEWGWSDKAPSGLVRLTMMRWRTMMKEAIREARQNRGRR